MLSSLLRITSNVVSIKHMYYASVFSSVDSITDEKGIIQGKLRE